MFSLLFEGTVLLAGLVLLWWAGDKSVRYAIESADLFGISSFTIGFLIMSISTALPELSTAVVSSLENVPELSAGDILGSSLVNLTLVLGATAFAAGRLSIKKEHESTILRITAMIAILASLIFFTGKLTLFHGLFLLAAYGICILLLRKKGLIKKIVKEEKKEAKELEKEEVLPGKIETILKLVGSIILVIVGARLAVSSAVNIGTSLDVPLEILGATVIAVGTGLPELTLELNCVKRKEYGLALGDIFGATLVNLTLTLGLLSVLSPTTIDVLPLIGIVPFFAIALIFIWYAMLKNHGLNRKHGAFLIFLFVLFLIEEIGILELYITGI